jgi:DNA anti-recombination protein RmuC
LQIERSAKEIYQNLARLNTELEKFMGIFETLGTQLSNAKSNYDKADKQLSAFSERLKSVQTLPEGNVRPQLDAFSSR